MGCSCSHWATALDASPSSMQVVHGVPLGTKRRRRDESDKGGRGAASVPSGAAELLTTLFPSGADRAHIAADGSVTAEVRQRQVPASLAIAIADYRSRTERDDGGGSTNHVEGSEAAGEGGEAVPPPCPSELQHGRAESTQHFDLDYADPGVVTGWGRDDSGKVMHALYLYTRKQGPAGPRILLLHAATTGGDSSSYRSVKPVDARSVRDVRKLLGCTHVESKSYPREDHRAETGERFVMWTNDLGAASGQPPNRTATVLAGGSVVYGAAIVHSQAHVVVDDAKAHSSPLEKAERAWDQACRAADERSPRARLATDREMWMRTFSSARSFRPSFVCEGCDCPANATTLADFLRTKKLRCLCGAHNHNERLFFKFLRTACGMPDVQHHTLRVDRKYELDFHDPVERVAFELDGSHHFYGAQGDETAKRDLEKERLMSTEHEGVALVRVPDVGPEHGWWHDHALYVVRALARCALAASSLGSRGVPRTSCTRTSATPTPSCAARAARVTLATLACRRWCRRRRAGRSVDGRSAGARQRMPSCASS